MLSQYGIFDSFAKGNVILYELFHDFTLDSELQFYLNLDMLTDLPFEKLGYNYLNNQLLKANVNVIEFRYNKILKILDDAEFDVDDNLKTNIQYL